MRTVLRKPFPANYATLIDRSLLSLCGARLVTRTLYSKINHLYNKGWEYRARNTTCCSGASVQTLTQSERCLIAVHGSVFGRKLAICWVLGFNHSCWRLLIIVLQRLVLAHNLHQPTVLLFLPKKGGHVRNQLTSGLVDSFFYYFHNLLTIHNVVGIFNAGTTLAFSFLLLLSKVGSFVSTAD